MRLEKQITSKKALIMEDDLSLRTVLRRILLSIAPLIEIDWVTSAEAALPRIRGDLLSQKNTYDLIITDIFLEGAITGIDFWQTCQVLCPHTSILLMSSMPSDHFFKAIGEIKKPPQFLSKPLHLAECRKVITKLLGQTETLPC